MISSSDRVMNYELATLVIGIRELARAAALFDDGARRILSDELLVAAARFNPRRFVPRFMRTARHDHDGAPLYRRLVA